MPDFAAPETLTGFVLLLVVTSFVISPRSAGADEFFSGASRSGQAPGLWTLVLSQVTTWIFARSLMNAAILGFYYGIAGVLAYTTYYGSFLTGALIISRLRKGGAASVQGWLTDQFGRPGAHGYNLVVGLRLMSEVFANLLVVGLIFGELYGGTEYASQTAMVLLALAGLGYSVLGGLHASLRTDVTQMLVFIIVFVAAFVALLSLPEFAWGAVLSANGISGSGPGWVLLVVALLQVISYPAHDPVMMDRGFLADEKTTRLSFVHAFWISGLCIFGFGLFGVQAGLMAGDGEAMQAVWERMFGPFVLFCLNAALIVSAVSTLDSALASAARLSIEEMRLGARTVANGRIAMVVFLLGGVLFLLAETEDLFAAVAISGTASMFLVPVLTLGLFGGLRIPLWSYAIAFLAAMMGAVAYFHQSSDLMMEIFGVGHKYERLLWICVAVLFVGFLACIGGILTERRLAERQVR